MASPENLEEMITLSSAHDYVVLFGIAALFGALGGIAYELLQTRSNETGTIEIPSLRSRHYFDLGFISSMILGAVAAIAISYFFTPEMQVKDTVAGAAVIRTKWQIAKVVPLSLIVGSAGGAFLEAMRGRVLGQLNAQRVASTAAAGKAAADSVASVAKALTSGQVANAGAQILASASGAIAGATNDVPSALRMNVLNLSEQAPHFAAIKDYLNSLGEPEPIENRVAQVSNSINDAFSGAAVTASAAIDASLAKAHAAIDAAAAATG